MQCLGEPTAGDQCRRRSAHVKPHEESNDRHAKVQEPLEEQRKRRGGGARTSRMQNVFRNTIRIARGTTGLGCPNFDCRVYLKDHGSTVTSAY